MNRTFLMIKYNKILGIYLVFHVREMFLSERERISERMMEGLKWNVKASNNSL